MRENWKQITAYQCQHCDEIVIGEEKKNHASECFDYRPKPRRNPYRQLEEGDAVEIDGKYHRIEEVE